jgi:putative oxidoreductase
MRKRSFSTSPDHLNVTFINTAMNFKRLLRLDFLPASADCGLLLLRVWLGLSMLLIHGMLKLQDFAGTVSTFHEKMGIPKAAAAAAVLAESVAAVFLVIGFATRWAALALAATMGVAFTFVHKWVLKQGDPGSGELAFIYLGGFLAIFLAGAGRWSVDAKLGR